MNSKIARRKAATICPVNFAYRTKIYNAVEIFISSPFANAKDMLCLTCITYNGHGFTHKDRKQGSYSFEFFTF